MAASSLFTDGLFEVSAGEEPGASLATVLAAIEALGETASITVISAISGDAITVYRGDTWAFTGVVTFALTGYEAAAFVVKASEAETDDQALLYVRSDTDLVRMAGAQPGVGSAPGTSDDGTLTIDDSTHFSVKIRLNQTNVAHGQYTWWLKCFDTTPTPDEGYTLATGPFTVQPYGLRASA